MVFQQGPKRLGLGLGIGLVMALGVTRLMKSILVTAPTDPLTFVTICTVLCLVGGLACRIPARRAMRVDPLVALRHEELLQEEVEVVLHANRGGGG